MKVPVAARWYVGDEPEPVSFDYSVEQANHKPRRWQVRMEQLQDRAVRIEDAELKQPQFVDKGIGPFRAA